MSTKTLEKHSYNPRTDLYVKIRKHSASDWSARRLYNAIARYYSLHKGHETEKEWIDDLKNEGFENFFYIPGVGRKSAITIINVIADMIRER